MYFFKQLMRTPIKTIFFLLLVVIITCLMSLGILMNMKSKSEIKNANKNFFADVKIENIDYMRLGAPIKENSIVMKDINKLLQSKYVSHSFIEKKLVAMSDNLKAYHGNLYQSSYDIYGMSVFEIEIIDEIDIRTKDYGYQYMGDNVLYKAKLLNVLAGVEQEKEIELYITKGYGDDYKDVFEKGKKYVVCVSYGSSDMTAIYHPGESKAYKFESISCYFVNIVYENREENSKKYGVLELKGDDYKQSDEYKLYKMFADACCYADREENISYLSCTNDSYAFREKKIVLINGRDISTEEYEEGKHVCLVSKSYYYKNNLKIGDKVNFKIRNNNNEHLDYQNTLWTIDDAKKIKYDDKEYTYEIIGVYVKRHNK